MNDYRQKITPHTATTHDFVIPPIRRTIHKGKHKQQGISATSLSTAGQRPYATTARPVARCLPAPSITFLVIGRASALGLLVPLLLILLCRY